MGIVASMYAFFFVSWIYLECITAATNITGGQPLGDAEILVSSNGIFQVGFFSPSNSTNRYIGVWYNKKDSDGLDVVWVANRENPGNDHSGVLKLSEGGNLQVLNGQNKILWSSNVSSETNDTVAELHDSGNLVLRSIASGTIIWQSFEHPTDSLLPKVKLTLNQSTSPVLHSWKSLSDPSSGRFTLGINPDRQLAEMFIWDGDKPYWRSGPWNGNLFLGVAYMHSEIVNGFRLINNPDGTYQFSYSVANQSLLERLVLHYDGRLFQEDWNDGSKSWEVIWQSLQSDCDIFSKCGPFGSCNPKSSPICSCLRGFVPKNSEEWSKGNWSGGCVRRTPLQCGTTAGKRDGFWKRKHMKVPDNAQWVSANQDNCKRKCLENCSCLAYAYYSGIGCMFWNESLIDIQQFFDDGADLFIRLSHSELGKKVKNKETKSHNYIFNARAAQVDFQELPLFDFEKLVVVTNDFSPKNKLGQGGFGPVYKGKLEDGREIAVKRLSKASGQGLQEFVNEIHFIEDF